MLTEQQLEILQTGANAVCVSGRWLWSIRGTPCGRAINNLKRRGLIDIAYYTGCRASASPTDKGREVARQIVAP